MAVGALDHKGEVVLDQAPADLHWVFGEGAYCGIEGFMGEEVVDAGCGGAEKGWIALREIGDSIGVKG